MSRTIDAIPRSLVILPALFLISYGVGYWYMTECWHEIDWSFFKIFSRGFGITFFVLLAINGSAGGPNYD